MEKRELGLLTLIIIGLLLSRLLPHSPNFTSTIAGLIFGGAMLRRSFFIFIILACYYVADLLINNTIYSVDHAQFQWLSQSAYWIYSSFLLIFWISRTFTERFQNPFALFVISLSSSILFFLFSNFGVWLENIIYVNDFTGLTNCFIAALPFFANEVAGTFFYTCLFFGTYWLYDSRKQFRAIAPEKI